MTIGFLAEPAIYCWYNEGYDDAEKYDKWKER